MSIERIIGCVPKVVWDDATEEKAEYLVIGGVVLVPKKTKYE